MSDTSAATLAECLLADAPHAAEPLELALRADPGLTLWTVCAAGEELRPPAVSGAAAGLSSDATADPRSGATLGLPSGDQYPLGQTRQDTPGSGGVPQGGCLAGLARWLAAHALDVLVFEWTGGPTLPGAEPTWEGPWVERLAAAVERAVLRASLAKWLARDDRPQIAEDAYLLGLLADPAPWFAGPSGPISREFDALLPRWLAEWRARPGSRGVDTAAAVLDESPGGVPEEVLWECRHRAAEARTLWLQPVPGAGRVLGELTARLRRLADLETRFQETLEAEKLAAMAEFAAGAGHEINNPLAVIAGRAQLFLQDETDPERRRGLALINAQAKRVWEMIADMRLFARPPRPRFESTDLVGLVDRLIEELSPEAAGQAVSLLRRDVAGPLVAEVDATQLRVALGAICRNAVEAIGHGGHVEIDLAEVGQEAHLRVLDDGPGVSEEVRRHLFDPYYSARQAGRGLGLGLSKAWRIVVTNHHGRIDVASGPGQPTVFTITLPRRQAEGGKSS